MNYPKTLYREDYLHFINNDHSPEAAKARAAHMCTVSTPEEHREKDPEIWKESPSDFLKPKLVVMASEKSFVEQAPIVPPPPKIKPIVTE